MLFGYYVGLFLGFFWILLVGAVLSIVLAKTRFGWICLAVSGIITAISIAGLIKQENYLFGAESSLTKWKLLIFFLIVAVSVVVIVLRRQPKKSNKKSNKKKKN